MSRRLLSLLACTLLLGLASSARAGIDVFINFDVDTDGNPVAHGAVIDNLYAPWGVTFGRTRDNTCNGGSHVYANADCINATANISPPNVVSLCDGATCSDISETGHGLVVALFNSPADIVCIEFNAVVAGHLGVLRAYDINHNLLAEDINSADYDNLCINVAGIKSVEFSGLASDFGWFDNLRVSYQVVGTEPSTWSGVKARF